MPVAVPPAPFSPTFETMETMTLPNGAVAYMNPQQYADSATAAKLATMFNAAGLVYADPQHSAFPGTAPSPARMLQFLTGSQIRGKYYGEPVIVTTPFTVNAGELAQCFLNNPESQFADFTFGSLAKRLAWGQIFDAFQYATVGH